MSDVGRALALRIPLSDCWKCLISAVSMRSMQTCVHNDAALTFYTQNAVCIPPVARRDPIRAINGHDVCRAAHERPISWYIQYDWLLWNTCVISGREGTKSYYPCLTQKLQWTTFNSRSLIILIWRKHNGRDLKNSHEKYRGDSNRWPNE